MSENHPTAFQIPRRFFWVAVLLLLSWSVVLAIEPGQAPQAGAMAWWAWVLILLGISFAIGFGAVLAGVGGGVVFVPVLAGFFPFHMDFVRGAGILVALATALAASPKLLRGHLVRLRLAMPCALVASCFAIVGVRVGFLLPVNVMQILLGVLILGATAVMAVAKRSEYPDVPALDQTARLFNLSGRFFEESTGEIHEWRVHRTLWGLTAFSLVGLISGMFGLGSGWASVPVLNLLMGVPLKMAVATSLAFLLPGTTAAAWGYLDQGAILPILVAPCLAGVMLGSRLGAIVLPRLQAHLIRRVVVIVLLASGTRALLKGLQLWN